MRTFIVSVIVAGFLATGVIDAFEHNWKSASVAVLFAIANGVIFFWQD